MAELLGDLYQGDSWNYPVRCAIAEESLLSMFSVLRTARTLTTAKLVFQGMKDTQILHTNSDVSTDSPSHAKVEEQSSFKVCSEKMLRGGSVLHFRSSFHILVCFAAEFGYRRVKWRMQDTFTHYGKTGNA